MNTFTEDDVRLLKRYYNWYTGAENTPEMGSGDKLAKIIRKIQDQMMAKPEEPERLSMHQRLIKVFSMVTDELAAHGACFLRMSPEGFTLTFMKQSPQPQIIHGEGHHSHDHTH